jgi:hypothetical protein
LSILTVSIFSIIQLAIIGNTSLAQCPCTVTVTVKDKVTDLPIPQAVVKVKDGSTTVAVGITDENGEVVFNDAEAGTYDVIANAQCYKRKKRSGVLVNGDDAFTFRLNLVSTDKQGILSGIVKDAFTGNGISGATVKILPDGPTVQTEVDGSYIFDCIQTRTNPYKVSASADGFIERKKEVTIEDPPATTTRNFALWPARIKGRVTDADTTDPIPDTLVEALFDGTTSVSDWDETGFNGKYALCLNPGTYRVRGSKFGYSPVTSSDVILGEIETEIVDLELTGCESTLWGKVWIKDTDPKEPIAGATVEITDPVVANPITTTNNKGRYEFERQCFDQGTTYTVEVRKAGFQTKDKTITPEVSDERLNYNLKIDVTSTTTTTSSTTTTTTTTSTVVGPTTTTSSTTITTTTTTTTTTSTVVGPTTTTSSTTTTTLCQPCAGGQAITYSKNCITFTFNIVGESGPREDNLLSTRNGSIETICGTVMYTDSLNIYCVEIKVRWGYPCILSIDEIKASFIGVGTTTTTTSTSTTTSSTTTSTSTSTTLEPSTTTTSTSTSTTSSTLEPGTTTTTTSTSTTSSTLEPGTTTTTTSTSTTSSTLEPGTTTTTTSTSTTSSTLEPGTTTTSTSTSTTSSTLEPGTTTTITSTSTTTTTLVGCQCPVESPDACISGVVTDGIGAPLEKIVKIERTLPVLPSFKTNTTTDRSGCYVFSGLEAGKYEVWVKGIGRPCGTEIRTIVIGEKVNNVNFTCD